MDLTEIWEEHKRFILAVGGALLVFFIGTRIVNAMYVNPAKRLDSSADRLERKLRRGVAPDSRDLSDLRKVEDDLDERLGAMEKRVRFQPRPDFVLAAGADFDLVYNDRYREVRDDLLERANIEDVDLDPSLGMPETTPTDRLDVQRHLKALDQVQRVVLVAMENGVEGIPAIRMLAEARKGFLSSQSYLDRTRVEYELEGTADAVIGVIEALQSSEQFLGIADCRIDLDSKVVDQVRAEVEVVGLEMDPDAPLVVEEESSSRRRRR